MRDISVVNLIFDHNARFVLAEPLACELYRRAGNAVPQTEFVRLKLNEQPMGCHLLSKQVNGSFPQHN